MNHEHQKIVDDLLARIHDKLAANYMRVQRDDGASVDELAAVVDERGDVVLGVRHHMKEGLRALLRATEDEQRGMLPVVFPLGSKHAIVWLSVTALTVGGDA